MCLDGIIATSILERISAPPPTALAPALAIAALALSSYRNNVSFGSNSNLTLIMFTLLASASPADGEMALSATRVLMAAGLAVAAMVSVVIGAWLGLTFHASEKLIANILAFGSGALVNALAIDLAY